MGVDKNICNDIKKYNHLNMKQNIDLMFCT